MGPSRVRRELFFEMGEVFGVVYVVVEFSFVHLQAERVGFVYRPPPPPSPPP